jgi:glyoxylase-like metal-dependent hydrolase (beta-lactamase superfamily II)
MVECPVTVLDRGTITADTNLAVDGTVTASASDRTPSLRRGPGVVYNLLLEHPEGTVLWDTGSHPDAGDGHWPADLYDAFTHADARPLERDLERAGYSLADVDCVVQSHLHLDHAGGLYAFERTDTPVYVHRDELTYAYRSAATDDHAGDEAYLAGDFDRELNWVVVDRRRHTLFPDLELVHLPGHSPGLLGMLLHRPDGSWLVVGDQAYVAANYENGAPMGASLLWSRRDWERSLARCRNLERRHDATVLYGHDADQIAALDGGF